MTNLEGLSDNELSDYYLRCLRRAWSYQRSGWQSLSDAEHARLEPARSEMALRGMRMPS